MKRVHILAVTVILACTVGICLASPINPSQNQSLRNVLEELNPKLRQFSLLSCGSKADCPDDESCINEGGICETSGCDGRCFRVIRCSCEDPCSSGLTCVSPEEESFDLAAICLPEIIIDQLDLLGGRVRPVTCDGGSDESGPEGSTAPDSSTAPDGESGGEGDEDGGDPVCIGIDLLEDYASHELVFDKHVLARVLCDAAGSCATRGHIVNYKGKAMMMGRYCDIVGCEQKVMKVNSPKYQRGLKVRSRSQDMHFTAFAARYGTVAEEAVLATAVRVGL